MNEGDHNKDVTDNENSDMDVPPNADNQKDNAGDDDNVPLAQLLGKKNNQTGKRAASYKKPPKKDHPSKGSRAKRRQWLPV